MAAQHADGDLGLQDRLIVEQPEPGETSVIVRRSGPDELIVRWNNVPRTAVASFYMPEIEVD